MSKIKSLILGSAATLVAVAGAQAADLPVKAKAVQYVKVCSLYGAGFYYIPGTDTCIKLGGYVQFDANINGNNYNAPGGIGAISSSGLFTSSGVPAGVSGTNSRDSGYLHHPLARAAEHRHPHRDRIRRCPHLLVAATSSIARAVVRPRAT